MLLSLAVNPANPAGRSLRREQSQPLVLCGRKGSHPPTLIPSWVLTISASYNHHSPSTLLLRCEFCTQQEMRGEARSESQEVESCLPSVYHKRCYLALNLTRKLLGRKFVTSRVTEH